MNFADWYLKSNLYARNYPASAQEFRDAVPLDIATDELFRIAGELLSIRMLPYQIRDILVRATV